MDFIDGKVVFRGAPKLARALAEAAGKYRVAFQMGNSGQAGDYEKESKHLNHSTAPLKVRNNALFQI